MKAKNRVTCPPIAAGQVWQLEDAVCRIGEVGKRLVHYKLLKGNNTRVPVSLVNKEVLEKHLKAKKAVLVAG